MLTSQLKWHTGYDEKEYSLSQWNENSVTLHLSPIEKAVYFSDHKNTRVKTGARTVAMHLATPSLPPPPNSTSYLAEYTTEFSGDNLTKQSRTLRLTHILMKATFEVRPILYN